MKGVNRKGENWQRTFPFPFCFVLFCFVLFFVLFVFCFVFAFHFWKPLKFILGLPKWKFLPGKSI